jgi:predicted nuclease with TOPRIM domain
MAKEFIKLDQEEETISKDIYKIGQEIAVLEARCRAKEQEQKQVKKRKEELFQGMTLLDAFASGRDIERDHAEKRRKLD